MIRCWWRRRFAFWLWSFNWLAWAVCVNFRLFVSTQFRPCWASVASWSEEQCECRLPFQVTFSFIVLTFVIASETKVASDAESDERRCHDYNHNLLSVATWREWRHVRLVNGGSHPQSCRIGLTTRKTSGRKWNAAGSVYHQPITLALITDFKSYKNTRTRWTRWQPSARCEV